MGGVVGGAGGYRVEATPAHGRIPAGYKTARLRWHLLVLVGEANFCRKRKKKKNVLFTQRQGMGAHTSDIFHSLRGFSMRLQTKLSGVCHFPTNASCQ